MNSIHRTQEQLLVASSIGYVNCDAKIRSDIQLLHPWATFSGDIHASPRNNQNHKLMGDYNTTFATLMATYLTHKFKNTLT